MPPIRLLVVEDDASLAARLVAGLKREGFEVELLANGNEAVEKALAGRFDLLILDLMLPERSGFEVLEQLQHRSGPPAIVLTARTDLDDRLRCFQLGAVDYVGKPFWIEELVARVRARVAAPAEAKRVLKFGSLAVDLDAREARVDGQAAVLTRTEFDILAYLAQRPGAAIARTVLSEKVLPSLEEVDARTIDVHVTRIRRKLGTEGGRLATVWGIGYRFEDGS